MDIEQAVSKVKTVQSFQELRKLLRTITPQPTAYLELDEPDNWRDFQYYARNAYGRLRSTARSEYPDADIPNVPLEWDIGLIEDLCTDAIAAIEKAEQSQPSLCIPLTTTQWCLVFGMSKKEFLALRKAEKSIYHFKPIFKNSHRLVLPIKEIPEGFLKKYHEAVIENIEIAKR